MTITQYLIDDHARLTRLLLAADREPFDHASFEEFRAGILRHIAIEEKLLFREVRALRGGEPLPAAHQLRIEHAAITSMLVPTPDAALVGELRTLLALHDGREEGSVYTECEAILGERSADLSDKARQFRAIPTMPHFDGAPGRPVYRTVREAMASARKIAPPKHVTP